MNTPQPRCVIKPPKTDIYSEAPHQATTARFAVWQSQPNSAATSATGRASPDSASATCAT